MWLFAWAAYAIDVIGTGHFIGVSLAVLYLIAINPPTLWVLKRIERPHQLANFSTLINLLEIAGYTAVIYALGGIEATYLTPIYATLIAYVGAMTERWRTFLIAAACATAYTVMVLMEGSGTIPWHRVNPNFTVTWSARVVYLCIVVTLLFVIAYIASYTAALRKRALDQLRDKNKELELQTERLLRAEQKLRVAQHDLENKELRLEIQVRAIAEKSLTESHETFLTVLDSIDATVYLADFQTHKILFMNRHMNDILGRDAV